MKYALGVDIGGTKIATVILDENKQIINRYESKSITNSKEAMFDQVIHTIDQVLLGADMEINQMQGMGVGLPGKVDREKGIAVFQNNLPWENFQLKSRLSEHYQFSKIRIDNDVHLATLSEWKGANLHTEASFVYLTISTGISCASIHQGKFIRGVGFAGEIGFLPVSTDLKDKRIEQLEQIASGPALEKIARNQFDDKQMTTKDLFEKYESGNEIAKKIIQSTAKSIAQGLYTILCILDPNQIILGGGVINNNPSFLELIKEELKKQIVPAQENSQNRITLSQYKGNSGLIGAALLAFQSD